MLARPDCVCVQARPDGNCREGVSPCNRAMPGVLKKEISTSSSSQFQAFKEYQQKMKDTDQPAEPSSSKGPPAYEKVDPSQYATPPTRYGLPPSIRLPSPPSRGFEGGAMVGMVGGEDMDPEGGGTPSQGPPGQMAIVAVPPGTVSIRGPAGILAESTGPNLGGGTHV